MHWYKRDPDAALAGMAELSLEERGAYNSILDLLYARDGDVPDDDVRVARMIGCHWREWKRLKERLVACGKVWLEGGKITARRVQETIREAAELSQKQSKNAADGWQKRKNNNENKEPPMPGGNASTTTTISTTTNKKEDGADAPAPKVTNRKKKPETELSDGFEPNWEAATHVGLSKREAEREFQKFKNHAAMNDRRCVNWQAAWANWCISAAQYLKKPQPGSAASSAQTITPASPSWNAWKSHFRDNNENVRASIMDKCADEGRAFTVKTEWPAGHEMNNAE